jgi:hypothetical protein
MDPKPNIKLRNTMPFRFFEASTTRLIWGCLIVLLSSGGLVLAGCQNQTRTDPSPPAAAPDVPPEEDVSGQASNSAQAPGRDSPADTTNGTPSPETVTPAPETTAVAQADSTLPDTLIRQWEPASNVLFTFGSMVITADQVQWGSGQSSPYTVVNTEGGYLLRLESSPSFYETSNPYIKLIPETDESGGITSIDVAFYESSSKAESNDYIMYGSYFVE